VVVKHKQKSVSKSKRLALEWLQEHNDGGINHLLFSNKKKTKAQICNCIHSTPNQKYTLLHLTKHFDHRKPSIRERTKAISLQGHGEKDSVALKSLNFGCQTADDNENS
jgi:hypothetical protein